MKNIRLYLVLAIVFILTGLYAFRDSRTKERKKSRYPKTLTVSALIKLTAEKEVEGNQYTVNGIFAGGVSAKDGYRLLLAADQPGVQLPCMIRSEQLPACLQIRKGSELVVNGTYSSKEGSPVLMDVVLISENIADSLFPSYSY